MLEVAMAQTKNRERTCVGCGRSSAPEDFVRVVLGPPLDSDAARPVAVDVAGRAVGRGAHVHPSRECVAKAARGGLARSFRCSVAADENELLDAIAVASERRFEGLLQGALRGRLLAVGADAVESALQRAKGFVVAAADAAHAIHGAGVQKAIAEGRAIVWKNKSALGALLGRNEVGVVSVQSLALGEELRRTRLRSEACRRPEEARAW